MAVTMEGQVSLEVIGGVIYKQGTDETVPLADAQAVRNLWANRLTEAQNEVTRLQAKIGTLRTVVDAWDALLAQAGV